MNQKLRHLVPCHAQTQLNNLIALTFTSDTGGTVFLLGGCGLLLVLGGGGRQGGHFGGEALEVGLKLVLRNGTN